METPSLGHVAILGVGLIGGSLGLALQAAGAAESVIGLDPNRRALQTALRRNAVTIAAADHEDAVKHANMVVIAAPLEAVIPTVRNILPYLPDEAVVTDVASAKLRVVRQCQQLLGGRFVGGHPMAGSERAGVAAADAGIFRDAPWILTPTLLTQPEALERVRTMVQATGARVRLCDPRTHDTVVAYTSHLPHIISYGLARTAWKGVHADWADLAGGSFRDCTRVSLSDPKRWAEILLDNDKAVVDALDALIVWLSRVRVAVKAADRTTVEQLLSEAHRARKRFPL